MKRLILIAIWAILFTKNSSLSAQENNNHPPITLDNADRIAQIESLGFGQIYSLEWIDHEQQLAVITTVGVVLYDVNNFDTPPELIHLHTGSASDKVISPDGQYVATGSKSLFSDTSIRLWDVLTSEQKITFYGSDRPVIKVIFSPDGTLLASGDDKGTVRVWSVETGMELTVIRSASDAVTDLAFSSDVGLIASSNADGTVGVWNTNTGSQVFLSGGQAVPESGINLFNTSALDVEFGPNNSSLISCSSDSMLHIWDINSGAATLSMEGCYGYPNGVTVHGNLMATSDRNGIQLWEDESAIEKLDLGNFGAGHLTFSPKGEAIAALVSDGTIQVWNVSTTSQVAILAGYTSAGYSVAFSTAGNMAASGHSNGTIYLWNLATAAEQAVLQDDSSDVTSVVFSPDETFFVSGVRGLPGDSNAIRLWDLTTQEPSVVVDNSYIVLGIALSPDGTQLAYPKNDLEANVFGLSQWNLETQEEIHFWEEEAVVTTARFSPDGRLVASGTEEGILHVRDVETGEILSVAFHRELPWLSEGVTSIAFSPDNSSVAFVTDDRDVLLVDITQNKLVNTLEAPVAGAYGIAFSPDGTLIAIPASEGIALWSVEDGKRVRVLEGHNGRVHSVAFSADGSLLISTGEDGAVRFWGIR